MDRTMTFEKIVAQRDTVRQHVKDAVAAGDDKEIDFWASRLTFWNAEIESRTKDGR